MAGWKGVERARADCPRCRRPQVPGGVRADDGHLILVRHKEPDGVTWCSNSERVDAGPASPLLAAAVQIADREAQENQET